MKISYISRILFKNLEKYLHYRFLENFKFFISGLVMAPYNGVIDCTVCTFKNEDYSFIFSLGLATSGLGLVTSSRGLGLAGSGLPLGLEVAGLVNNTGIM